MEQSKRNSKTLSGNMQTSLKRGVGKFVPETLKHQYRIKKNEHYKRAFYKKEEIQRLRDMPRYTNGITNLLGKPFAFTDAASFLFIFDELFQKEIYKFNSSTAEPLILDCGANIGLSVLYFKQLYPKARIIAFEPDPEAFKTLGKNLQTFSLDRVQLLEAACWNSEMELDFFCEGADGGRLATADVQDQTSLVKGVRLKNYLTGPVELLKIDIEGAEVTVLEDCADALLNVRQIFVEYHSFADQPQQLDHLLRVLSNAGFRYQIQHVGVFSSHPFLDIRTSLGMDLQLNIFGYR